MSKVVIAEYKCTECFKIPKGLDLEDETQVIDWYVKWNTLFITKADGTEIEIESEGWTQDMDYKFPVDEPTIDDAADHGINDEEEEEGYVLK